MFDRGSLSPTYVKPFDVLAKGSETGDGLAALDDFRNWLIRKAASRRLLSFLGEPAVPDWIDRASRKQRRSFDAPLLLWYPYETYRYETY